MADPGLQGQDVLASGLQVRHQLVVGLDGAEALVRGDRVDQRAQQRGLARPLITGDHHRLAGQHRGVQELGHLDRHQTTGGQIGQRHVGEDVLADHHAGPVRQAEPDGVQTEAVAESEGHGRVRVVERPRGLVVLAQEADGLHQLVVAVGDRRHLLAPTVAVLDDDRVPAVDLDVLDVREIEQGLQPAVAEHRVLHRLHVRVLALGRPQVGAVAMQGSDVVTDDAADQRPAEQQPVVSGQWPSGSPGLRLGLVGDGLGGPPPQLDHLRPLDQVVRHPSRRAPAPRCGRTPRSRQRDRWCRRGSVGDVSPSWRSPVRDRPAPGRRSVGGAVGRLSSMLIP